MKNICKVELISINELEVFKYLRKKLGYDIKHAKEKAQNGQTIDFFGPDEAIKFYNYLHNGLPNSAKLHIEKTYDTSGAIGSYGFTVEQIEEDHKYGKELYNNINLLIIGNARHGKDTVAELLKEYYGISFISSSQACADIFIYDALKDKYGYQTPEECFLDRVNHRDEWYRMICDYNKDDKARLAKEILKYNNTYVGMRDWSEIQECLKQGLFDLVIWVDASERLPQESAESFNITKADADIIIENNGTLEELKERIQRIGKLLKK
jgi:dephospho-CoA kinase